MNAQHTPGPWLAQKDCRGEHNHGIITDGPMAWGIYGPSFRLGVLHDPRPWCSDAEITANARLIAAAPELLAALAEIIAVHDLEPHRTRPIAPMDSPLAAQAINLARSAVAKATGQE